MNLDDKLKRLNQLKKIDYPSDQEFEEMQQLEEEIKLEQNQPDTQIEETKQNEQVRLIQEEIAKPKPSLLRKILRVKQKEPERPVTYTELEQLTMEAKKQEILSRIAKAKAEQNKAKASGPSIFESIQKVIGKSNNNPFDASPRSSKKGYDPFR